MWRSVFCVGTITHMSNRNFIAVREITYEKFNLKYSRGYARRGEEGGATNLSPLRAYEKWCRQKDACGNMLAVLFRPKSCRYANFCVVFTRIEDKYFGSIVQFHSLSPSFLSSGRVLTRNFFLRSFRELWRHTYSYLAENMARARAEGKGSELIRPEMSFSYTLSRTVLSK